MLDDTCCTVAATPRETVTSRLNQLLGMSEDLVNGCGYVHRRLKGGETDCLKMPDPNCIETELDIVIARLSLARDYINGVCNTIN